jgi:hypothetical protein
MLRGLERPIGGSVSVRESEKGNGVPGLGSLRGVWVGEMRHS